MICLILFHYPVDKDCFKNCGLARNSMGEHAPHADSSSFFTLITLARLRAPSLFPDGRMGQCKAPVLLRWGNLCPPLFHSFIFDFEFWSFFHMFFSLLLGINLNSKSITSTCCHAIKFHNLFTYFAIDIAKFRILIVFFIVMSKAF